MYIYQHSQWPQFIWDEAILIHHLAGVRHKQGLLLGRMNTLGFDLRSEASLEVLTADIVKSGAIEGEHLQDNEVRSSLAMPSTYSWLPQSRQELPDLTSQNG